MKIDRRSFVKLSAVTAASAIVGGGAGYALLRDPDPLADFYASTEKVLGTRFGRRRVTMLLQDIRSEYGALTTKVPYIGGEGNVFTEWLTYGVYYLAMYRVLKSLGQSIEQAGRITYETYEAMADHPRWLLGLVGSLKYGARYVERLRAALADRYRIEGELGSGGMATVYLAEDLKHPRKVAIKVLKPALAESLGHDRFLREVEIVAGLTHPNILKLIDSGESDGLLFFVMPYVSGETLQDRIRRGGPLPVEEALRIAREVADALAYAHENGVIHRDIKPSNILFEAGHAVISDFGVARAVGAAGGTEATATGIAVGTPKYMSPEQATGGEVDGRADIYALGCVLWEMLAGGAPFDGPTPQAILAFNETHGKKIGLFHVTC